MKKLFKKLFLVREIKSKSGVLHFRRWRIISTPWFGIFIHNIFVEDKDKHLHDHPWDYISIVLRGEFIEAKRNGNPEWHNPWSFTQMKPFMYVCRDAGQYHKVTKVMKPVTTLFFTGSKYRDWGYYVDGIWIPHQKYRNLKNSGELEKIEDVRFIQQKVGILS